MRTPIVKTGYALSLAFLPVFCLCAVTIVGLYQALKTVFWLIHPTS